MKHFLFVASLTFLACTNSLFGQMDQMIEKQFLIAHSSKDYQAALKTAKKIAKELNYKFDLRGYYPIKDGLDTDELCGCGENHGYIPRGRYDDGVYVSIEYSSAFSGFAKGYYIVVVASSQLGDQDIKDALKEVRKIVKDAYIKRSSVYIGCMH